MKGYFKCVLPKLIHTNVGNLLMSKGSNAIKVNSKMVPSLIIGTLSLRFDTQLKNISRSPSSTIGKTVYQSI